MTWAKLILLRVNSPDFWAVHTKAMKPGFVFMANDELSGTVVPTHILRIFQSNFGRAVTALGPWSQ